MMITIATTRVVAVVTLVSTRRSFGFRHHGMCHGTIARLIRFYHEKDRALVCTRHSFGVRAHRLAVILFRFTISLYQR
jgi:hypothetical protein